MNTHSSKPTFMRSPITNQILKQIQLFLYQEDFP